MRTIQYVNFLYQGIVYSLPIVHTGIDRNGRPRYDSGIADWWTYHLTFDEYFNIIYYGICLNSGFLMNKDF